MRYESSTTPARAAPHGTESGEAGPIRTEAVRGASVADTIARGTTMLDVGRGTGVVAGGGSTGPGVLDPEWGSKRSSACRRGRRRQRLIASRIRAPTVTTEAARHAVTQK